MIPWLLHPFFGKVPVLGVFRYITFRAANAALMALLLAVFLGPSLIRWLRSKQIGQSIREEGPKAHQAKAGTPTMGGVLINLAIVVPTLLFADLTNRYVWVALGATVLAMVIGIGDDWRKVSRKQNRGLTGRQKLVLQAVIGLAVGWAAVNAFDGRVDATHVAFPFLKNVHPDLGALYVLFAAVVVVGSSNAVNLTDGLDGLAAGTVAIAASAFAAVSVLTGHEDLSYFCVAMAAACLAFLRFNAHPAKVFMGDTGSLALGGALAAVGILTHTELLLVVIGFVFVCEALSVIIQVISFQTTGKRVFRMSPIHHHFELGGWSEWKVVTVFWCVGLIASVAGLSLAAH